MKIIICGSISAAEEILSAKKKLEDMRYEVEIPEGVKNFDVVLVVNPEKRGVQGYVGGNTLIEMAFGHVLGKKLYVLNPLPELSYTSEILAMQPVVINGNLSMIH